MRRPTTVRMGMAAAKRTLVKKVVGSNPSDRVFFACKVSAKDYRLYK